MKKLLIKHWYILMLILVALIMVSMGYLASCWAGQAGAADKTGYILIWEEIYSSDPIEHDIKYFQDKSSAIAYLNKNEVTKMAWEGTTFRFFIIGSDRRKPDEKRFLGMFEIGKKINIKKKLIFIKHQKEVWEESE